jgi:hypothetical protein
MQIEITGFVHPEVVATSYAPYVKQSDLERLLESKGLVYSCGMSGAEIFEDRRIRRIYMDVDGHRKSFGYVISEELLAEIKPDLQRLHDVNQEERYLGFADHELDQDREKANELVESLKKYFEQDFDCKQKDIDRQRKKKA